MAATFGGYEVTALVLDVGTAWTRAGYAGEDCPKAVFPTAYGYLPEEESEDKVRDNQAVDTDVSNIKKPKGKYYLGDGEINVWRPNMEVKNPLNDGLVEDWDALEQIWDYALKSRLHVDPREHPLLVSEVAWNTREHREKLIELAFEKYETPAFYVAKNPVLTAYASGRPTAMILDCGAAVTSVTPVYDGFVLKKGIIKQPIAGDFINEQILLQFGQLNLNPVPQYLVEKKNYVDPDQPANVILRNRPNTTASFHKYMLMKIVHEYKESVCQLYESTYNEQVISSRPMKTFEFPDGYNTSFGTERFRAPEILFQPSSEFIIPSPEPTVDTSPCVGIHHMIFNSLVTCDIDARPAMMSNLIVTGGSTLFPGFVDRLYHEVAPKVPGMKVRIHAPGNSMERKCSSWLGGSILASLGTFHQLWISRKEYDEHGKGIVEKKCDY
ncbi:5421_t:CDS:2 [Paraglomus occultum]|uniref:5421_t:CDS:1 n=1 Tax=Paraglomus occultum TaxID=144539 RepID=A0A9N9CGA4_9GLOM|nr:5421_t:CDS:2 [Paraglomus occultum]